mgnify:CR=1 FL=1
MTTIVTTPVTSARRIPVPPKIADILGGLVAGDVIVFSYESGRIVIEKSEVKA